VWSGEPFAWTAGVLAGDSACNAHSQLFAGAAPARTPAVQGGAMTTEPILAHFREQAMFCTAYGSPFTGQLINCMADDIAAGGPVAKLVAGWPSNPRADALSLRLAGALHAAVLTGKDFELAAAYPGQDLLPLRGEGGPKGRMRGLASAAKQSISPHPSLRDTLSPQGEREVWPIARAFLEREHDWVRDFMQSPPQTNETRRSIALLAGFLAFAKDWRGPIDVLEIGASAGLNLFWDKFSYHTSSWAWGAPSAVAIDTDWQGPAPPIEAQPNIRQRAACDLNPLDLRDPAALLRLKSYIWPDQPERLARFDGAVALALANDVRVERASADDWLARKLAARADDAATIVYHSVFLQYPPREVRAAIVDAIRAAGEAATPQAPLAWVRLEPEAVTDDVVNGLRFVVDLTTWPGGTRQILGYTDGHVRTVYAQ
jgi:hypothetical protein